MKCFMSLFLNFIKTPLTNNFPRDGVNGFANPCPFHPWPLLWDVREVEQYLHHLPFLPFHDQNNHCHRYHEIMIFL